VPALELACLAIVVAYVSLRLRGAADRGAAARRLALLAAAAWVAEDTVLRAYDFYAYAPDWSLFLDRVPLLIVLIWPVVIDSAGELAAALGSGRRVPRIAGLIVLADAALIEPIAVHAELWAWRHPGWFAVPPIGVLGWALFAAVAIALLDRWPGRRGALAIVAAPALVHVGLLAGWWGALRWIDRPLAAAPLVAVAWILAIAVTRQAARGAPAPRPLILRRAPGAAFFFGLLLWRPAPTELVAYALAFAPPYLALLARGGVPATRRADHPGADLTA
jgi:hypothetical protein